MRPTTIEAAREFLALATGGDAPDLWRLAAALDRLAAAYHETPVGVAAAVVPPPNDSAALRAIIAPRFGLGLYADADPLDLEGEPLVGDAIDDLTDITDELGRVLWLADTVGEDAAHHAYRSGFRTHWGRHLRGLAHYLHACILRAAPP